MSVRLVLVAVLLLALAAAPALAADGAGGNATGVNATTTTPPPGGQTPQDIFEAAARGMERSMSSPSTSIAAYIIILGFIGVMLYLVWRYTSPSHESPAVDLVVDVYDTATRTRQTMGFTKISENLYLSMDGDDPVFLYVPPEAPVYACGKKACGLAVKEKIFAMLVDPVHAAVDSLARLSGFIRFTEGELDKLMVELFRRVRDKTGYIPVSPDLSIAAEFNVEGMIKAHMRLLRESDEMMVHFLQTAGQAESIERLIRERARLAESKMSWVWYVLLLVIGIAVAIAIIGSVTGGGG